MRSILKTVIFSITMTMLCVVMAACSNQKKEENLWENAVYTENTVLGEGEKSVVVEVAAQDKSVTFTINTDKENLEEALTEHNIVSGEKGAYGLYIKVVNGITADYNVNQSYWSLSKNGEYMQTGAGDTKISDGDKYELTYTK